MQDFFFDNWESIIRTVGIGTLSYLGLVFFLRVSGKRTLSKMNMFDFVVTVALGSTLATVILSKNVSLAQGMIALGLLVLLQFVFTFFEIRNKSFKKLIKASPSLLYFNSTFNDAILRRERVAREEVFAAIRRQGYGAASEVEAVILETDGTFSVIANSPVGVSELKSQGVIVD